MSVENLRNKVRPIVAELLCKPVEEVTDDIALFVKPGVDHLDGDSLDAVELTMLLEEHWTIQISDDDASEHFGTVSSIADFLSSRGCS